VTQDELQIRIAEQKKLVDDKKKLIQNLKNLEQVEKEVRVEIDKILPEKTKFEEWAKYFGNDGKTDQVLNWFGDELQKLKAKLDRVQGMRTKILSVQEKIDSQLVRLNLEIENLKKLPKPVVPPEPGEIMGISVLVPDSEVPPSTGAKSMLSSEVKPAAPPIQTEAPKPVILPKPAEKSPLPGISVPAEKVVKVTVEPKEIPAANKPVAPPIQTEAPKPVILPKPAEKSPLPGISVPAEKVVKTPVESKDAKEPGKPTVIQSGSPEKKTAENLIAQPKLPEKPSLVVPAPKTVAIPQGSGKPAAEKDAGFSPAHKNLLQDIAKKAKVTTEKMETEANEKTDWRKPQPVKSEVAQPVPEKKEAASQNAKGTGEKAPVNIAAQSAGVPKTKLEKPSGQVPEVKPEMPVQSKTSVSIETGKKEFSENNAAGKPEKSLSQKLKEQKHQYINHQPVRENEAGEIEPIAETDNLSRNAPGTVSEAEKRSEVLSNIKGKFFDKFSTNALDQKSAEELALHPGAAGKSKSEWVDLPKLAAKPITGGTEKSAPAKTEKNIEVRSIFDDPAPVSKPGGIAGKVTGGEVSSLPKADAKTDLANTQKRPEPTPGEIQKIFNAGGTALNKSANERAGREEIVIQAKSWLDDPIENKKEISMGKPDANHKVERTLSPAPPPQVQAKKENVVEATSVLIAPPTSLKLPAVESGKNEFVIEKSPVAPKPVGLPKMEFKATPSKPVAETTSAPVLNMPPEAPIKAGLAKVAVAPKATETKPAQEIFIETQSLLFDLPKETPVKPEISEKAPLVGKPESDKATPVAIIPTAKIDLRGPEEKPIPDSPAESAKPEIVAPVVDTEPDQSGGHARNLPSFRSKQDILYLGIDLGTYETTIAASNGVIATAISAVGWPKDLISRNLLKKNILFGEEALKHKLALRFYRPLAEGVIKNTEEDLAAATELIKYVLTLIRPEKFKKVYAVIGAPAQANLHNEQAIFDAAREVIDAVTIVSEPFAVAYGEANIYNTLVIDIGAGTTDLCRLRGTMPEEGDQITLLKAGDYIDAQLVDALEQRVKGVQVTKDMARRWKEAYSFVMLPPKPVVVEVTVEGKPLRVDISSCIQKSCEMIVDDLADAARKLISTFDPEFQPDLKQNIILAGGGSLIQNLDIYLTQKLNMLGKVNIKKVANPIEAGAKGALALAMDVTDDFWRGLS
jgi:rod shape-determining protein MreB